MVDRARSKRGWKLLDQRDLYGLPAALCALLSPSRRADRAEHHHHHHQRSDAREKKLRYFLPPHLVTIRRIQRIFAQKPQ
jgi:hypothetical protein